MEYIPEVVFLKKGFTIEKDMSVNCNDIWTRRQSTMDVCFKYTNQHPQMPLGKNKINFIERNISLLCELYLHQDNSKCRSFYIKPKSNRDIVYKL